MDQADNQQKNPRNGGGELQVNIDVPDLELTDEPLIKTGAVEIP